MFEAGITYVRAESVVIPCSPVTTSQFGDPARRLVYLNHITRKNLFLCELINHLGAEVVNRFHICRLQGQSSGFCRLYH